MPVVKPITELLCSTFARILGRERKLEEFASPKSQPSIPKKGDCPILIIWCSNQCIEFITFYSCLHGNFFPKQTKVEKDSL